MTGDLTGVRFIDPSESPDLILEVIGPGSLRSTDVIIKPIDHDHCWQRSAAYVQELLTRLYVLRKDIPRYFLGVNFPIPFFFAGEDRWVRNPRQALPITQEGAINLIHSRVPRGQIPLVYTCTIATALKEYQPDDPVILTLQS
ncbi:hypothetical protein [Pantanalinema sp. GBBB05]|uniref:hypothetical protein n=1 Tax=Pantanalinema sp. GBBB05 TaxID=2604139 RepID=UPI001D23D528|nr:hypothetical protein [Pantanalinema sp. GBBB05]